MLGLIPYAPCTKTAGESIDDLLVRFDCTRQTAATEGGIGMNVKALSLILLRAVGPNDTQLLQLLQPFDNQYPNDDNELLEMMQAIRRMGHILERHTGDIASLLRGNGRARRARHAGP